MSRAVFAFTKVAEKEIVDTIEFDLIDNSGTRAWQYAVMLNNKNRHVSIGGPGGYIPVRPSSMKDNYHQLKKIIKELESTQFKIDFDVPESEDRITQHLLNRLHRHFTESCATLWDPRYRDFSNQSIFNQLLQTLNELIHQLEPYLPTDQKIKYSWINQQELRVINDGRELGYDIFPFRHFHSWEPADLILDPYILGKTLLDSFMCDDDPVNWDTSGHVKTNGGCCIMLSDHRRKVYESKEFVSWLQQHDVDKNSVFADFPLGFFVEGHRNRLDQLLPNLRKLSCTVDIVL